MIPESIPTTRMQRLLRRFDDLIERHPELAIAIILAAASLVNIIEGVAP